MESETSSKKGGKTYHLIFSGIAIRELPKDLSKDYYDAIHMAPIIMTEEIRPMDFVLCENGNTWSAALRLVQNISLRRRVFGEEYWLRPMRMKDGALRSTDVTLLRAGSFVLCTPPAHLQQSQVMVIDYGKLEGESCVVRQRLAYFVLWTGLNKFTRQNGLDVIFANNGKGMKVDPQNGRIIQLTNSSSGFRLRKIVLVRDPTDSRRTLMHLFEHLVFRLIGKFWEGRQVFTVSEKSPPGTMRALRTHGFHPSCIPSNLGGHWSYDVVDQWIVERMRIESRIASSGTISRGMESMPTTNASISLQVQRANYPLDFPSTNFLQPNPSSAAGITIGPLKNDVDTIDRGLTGTAMIEATRKISPSMNYEYTDGLIETDLIRKTRDALGVEEASEEVRQVRQRNALYSRRSYHKRKRKRESLETQIKELENTQRILQAEQELLEKLLKLARDITNTTLRDD